MLLDIVEIKTQNFIYLFDSKSTELFPVTENQLDIINNYYNKSFIELELNMKHRYANKNDFKLDYEYISLLIKEGMIYSDKELLGNNINMIEQIYESAGSGLTFILTEQCNLRCEYCCYSNKYPHEMAYSNEKMNFETAKKGFNIFWEIHKKKIQNGMQNEMAISFYGGEPLLNFKLIKRIVEYVKLFNKDTIFYITTNGTIMTDEMINLFIYNNFEITFSLDGFKENHDRNRVDINSNPTFDKIINNIYKLQEAKKRLNITQHINFNCCIDECTDFIKCAKFFDKNYNMFYPYMVRYSSINPNDTIYFDWLRERAENKRYNLDCTVSKKTYLQLKEEFFNNNSKWKHKESVLDIFSALHMFLTRNKWSNSPLLRCCIPLSKLALYPNGEFNVCEKMNKKFSIGNIDIGIDFVAIQYLIDKFKSNMIKYNCNSCKYRNLCLACFMFMDESGVISKDFCLKQREQSKKIIKEYCEMLEMHPDYVKYLKLN